MRATLLHGGELHEIQLFPLLKLLYRALHCKLHIPAKTLQGARSS